MKISIYDKTLSLKELSALELAALQSLVEFEVDRRNKEVEVEPETADISKCKWFTFDQNNSGGSFHVDDNVGEYVIVQAENADQSNRLAEKVGLYFDGVGDCDCCGNRWHEVYGDGTEKPEVYSEEIPHSREKSVYNFSGKSGYPNNATVILYPFGSIQ